DRGRQNARPDRSGLPAGVWILRRGRPAGRPGSPRSCLTVVGSYRTRLIRRPSRGAEARASAGIIPGFRPDAQRRGAHPLDESKSPAPRSPDPKDPTPSEQPDGTGDRAPAKDAPKPAASGAPATPSGPTPQRNPPAASPPPATPAQSTSGSAP